MEIGDRLSKLMAYRGVSQAQLAARLEKSQATVSNWATGKGYPKLKELRALARELRTTISYLVDDEDERTPAEMEWEMDVRKIVDAIGWQEAYHRLIGASSPTPPPFGPSRPVETAK